MESEFVKQLLPFGNPIVSQNPMDALIMAIIDAHDAYSNISNCFLDVYAYGFCDKDKFYYDAHFNSIVSGIEYTSTRTQATKSIKETLIDCISNNYYATTLLDLGNINCFATKSKRYFAHSVTIYGFDTQTQIFNIADFGANGSYIKQQASFDEIELAHHSVIEHMNESITCQNPLQGMSVQLKKFIGTNTTSTNLNDFKFSIDAFLKGECSKKYMESCQRDTISRSSLEKSHYEVPVLTTVFGKHVLSGIVEHTKNCLLDKCYIYEKKGIYLLFSQVQLLAVYLQSLLQQTELSKQDDVCCNLQDIQSEVNKLLKTAKVLLIIGKKYEVTKSNEDLIKVIDKAKEIEKAYIIILQNILKVININ